MAKCVIRKHRPRHVTSYREYFSTLSLDQQEAHLRILLRWVLASPEEKKRILEEAKRAFGDNLPPLLEG